MASHEHHTRARVRALEALCGELYQVLGTVGAPVAVLDAVAAAAAGRPLPRRDLLPIDEMAFDEVRKRQTLITAMREVLGATAAQELGRSGGRARSAKKARAARANGLKGGRPSRALASKTS